MTGGLMKTTSTLAIAAAATLMLGSVTLPTAARAADLGGDCCADLEGRVAELEATTARKGNKRVSLTITGRVAATMTFWNDSGPVSTAAYDELSDVSYGGVGDGPIVVFKGEGRIRSDLTAGYYMELDDGLGGFTQNSHTGGGVGKPSQANVYVYLASKSLGTLQLGKIDSAADQYGVNYDGSWIGGHTGGRANRQFKVRDTAGAFTARLFSDYIGTFAQGGETGIRYISPTIGGFSFNASHLGDDKTGFGVNYGATHGTVTLGFGAAYGVDSRFDATPSVTYKGVSAGFKESSSGIFLAARWDQKTVDLAGYSPTTVSVNGGWAKNVTGAGDTTIHASYARSNDLAALGTSAHTTIVGLDQKIDSAESHIFVQYEGTTIDTPIVGVAPIKSDAAESISSVTAGMSVQF
jgi:hypothetical protein